MTLVTIEVARDLLSAAPEETPLGLLRQRGVDVGFVRDWIAAGVKLKHPREAIAAASAVLLSVDATQTLDRSRWTRRLMRVGQALLPFAKATDDDLVAAFLVQTSTENFGADGPTMAAYLLSLGRWAQHHFPVLHLTARQSCALALSDLTEAQLKTARAPWPVFALVTEDAFSSKDAGVVGTLVKQTRSRWPALVARDDEQREYNGLWTCSLDLSDYTTLWKLNNTTTQLYTSNEQQLIGGGDSTFWEMDTEEDRICQLVGRATLNACAALAGKAATLGRAKKRKRKGGKARPVIGGLNYSLAMPVRVDMRDHVRRYLRGESSRAYKVRWVVRGHWRNQAHGPALLLRRMRWIEPYWKGPECAPKLVRSHEIVEGNDGN